MKQLMRMALVGVVAATPAWACKYPVPPRDLPAGHLAAREAMLATKREVDRYLREVYEYMECESDGTRLMEVQAQLKQITARFNAEVRKFKAANGG